MIANVELGKYSEKNDNNTLSLGDTISQDLLFAFAHLSLAYNAPHT